MNGQGNDIVFESVSKQNRFVVVIFSCFYFFLPCGASAFVLSHHKLPKALFLFVLVWPEKVNTNPHGYRILILLPSL
ncbi:hypothetical protein [Mucilaginibacter sp. OK283]|jgi:hypothetical protein|uniref:hypothetical protein n=1 Tax=Mucilaginibacter sp. OK283 TaxID=1881049 RepID=UPI000B89271A|nr:hypothetical protein [Mucilaginibacter sp. OK283]